MQVAPAPVDSPAGADLGARLVEYIGKCHPRSLGGVMEARAIDPGRFDAYANRFLGWAVRAFGDEVIERMADAFVGFSYDVNLAQARYEETGQYENKSYRECEERVYARDDTMSEYLMGIYLTNFLWAHHMEISLFFEDRFLPGLASSSLLVEIAPGHGAWGLWALSGISDGRLTAFDVSPTAIEMAQAVARAANLEQRANYRLLDALSIEPEAIGAADACICSFLIEHLEEPEALLRVIGSVLRPKGTAFLTGALTAAQIDHIFEFRRESELVLLAERHGLRVTDLRSVGPRRTLRNARFLPRSIALILQKRTHETW